MDALAELQSLISGLGPTERAELDALIADELKRPWLPNPGPQSEAFWSKADIVLYGGAAGGGKALALDTPLATPDGWTTMGAVRVGDTLFDERGQPCTVTAATPVMIGHPCFRVCFSDGAEIVADADHRWFTATASERVTGLRRSDAWKAKRRAVRPSRGTGKRPDLALRNSNTAKGSEPVSGSVRTTDEISRTLLDGPRLNHSVAVCAPLKMPAVDLPIEPYLLGAWLGDGSSYSSRFTTADAEMYQAFSDAGYEVAHYGGYSYRINGGFHVALRVAGMLKNKHIPPLYLRASEDQRIALLQGLMDTDGYCDPRGQCEFYTVKRGLADQVLELILSLGCKATIGEGRATLNGRDCGPKYRIKFLASFAAFRLGRKAGRQKTSGFRGTSERRYIEDVRLVPSVPVRCIAVDSPNHLYLCGREMIPTHNTDLIVGLALEHQRTVVFRRMYGELSDIAERFLTVLGSRQGYSAAPQMRYRNGGRLVEFGALQNPGSHLAWRGRPHDLICFDEIAELEKEKVEFVIGWLRSTDAKQRCRVLMASNPPTGGEGEWLIKWFAPWLDPLFADPAAPGELRWAFERSGETVWTDGPGETCYEGESDPYAHLSRTFIPARLDDNPYLRETGYRSRLQSLPEPLRSQLLKGDFLAGREDHEWQVIPTLWVEAAQERWKNAPPKRRRMLALSGDIAGGGNDNSALAALHEDAWFAPVLVKKTADIQDVSVIQSELAAWMVQQQKDGADLSIDGTGGWGPGVRSYLITNHKLECASLIYSAGSERRTKDSRLGFKNLRAEMYWGLREALDPESGDDVMLPPDPKLKAQLTAPRYSIVGTDIKIEAKDEVKARVGSSPDEADAVAQVWKRRRALVAKPKHTHAKTIGGGWMGR